MKRIHFAFTAKTEAKVLDFLVARLPQWVTPDFLTLVALASATLSGLFYLLASHSLFFLWGINFLLIVHWFADSLDGRVARYRKISRPKYGFYIDHLLDSISVCLILGGLESSPISQTSAPTFALAIMLIFMIHAFLKANALGVLELSIQQVGPTEARLALIAINTLVFFSGNPQFIIFNSSLRLIDLIGWLGILASLPLLISDIIKTALILDRKDRSKNSLRE